MSGELNEERDFAVVYDSGFKPSMSSARDVLAFVLTPISAIVNGTPEELEEAAVMFSAAKQDAVEQWLRLRKGARPV